MNSRKKLAYLLFTGGLTASALWAFYWQSTKYLRASQKWRIITEQLDTDQPTDLAEVGKTESPSAFMYVKCKGRLSDKFVLVNRARGQRLGYYVLRSLSFDQPLGNHQGVVAFEGWIPQGHNSAAILQQPKTESNFRGLLRSGESIDYLTSSFSKEKLAKEGITAFIDLKQLVKDLQLQPTSLNENYFIQLFRTIDNHEVYPSRATKQDFQRPYLTPAKHRDYATFWGCTSLVGLAAILKVLRMK